MTIYDAGKRTSDTGWLKRGGLPLLITGKSRSEIITFLDKNRGIRFTVGHGSKLNAWFGHYTRHLGGDKGSVKKDWWVRFNRHEPPIAAPLKHLIGKHRKYLYLTNEASTPSIWESQKNKRKIDSWDTSRGEEREVGMNLVLSSLCRSSA